MNTIVQRTDRPSPDPTRTRTYYSSLFAVDPARDRRRTPMFSRWLERMHEYASTGNFDQQMSAERLTRTISRTINESPPWKAYFTVQAINGQRKVQEADVRARVILIHKAGYRGPGELSADSRVKCRL
ncbi:unnamed protein product [Trichogramma brassicae]|uniref:Uncharacterized protein n=1 Tax=Trichogramma brassicae TaxID=86971 RepID=A0A6H5I2G5_9HYME|nr:unnamed protein product [Trichogramma brassicae]